MIETMMVAFNFVKLGLGLIILCIFQYTFSLFLFWAF